MLPEAFRCYLVRKDDQGNVAARISTRRIDELPEGEVVIRVAWSSLNYKDAMAMKGHPGVAKVLPHIPGVDAAGTVVQSGVDQFVAGDQVIVTGFDVGANRWGAYAEYLRVPQDWVVPLPDGLTLRESMILGTAGFTAGLGVDALEKHDVTPERGDVVVTGASGGVGSMAVAILSKLGYRVVAVTGKESAHEYLRLLGAAEIVGREAVTEGDDKPLRSGRWAGGMDTVGGKMLSSVIRATRHGGCIAACGMAGGVDLPITVYPFILRGVVLAGIDAAWGPLPLRHATWARLAGDWKPDRLDEMAEFISLEALPAKVDEILAGRIMGRVVVKIQEP